MCPDYRSEDPLFNSAFTALIFTGKKTPLTSALSTIPPGQMDLSVHSCGTRHHETKAAAWVFMTARDLVALWEKHCRCEFETRDADATMATMIPEPYVNHIPTMTGGVGYEQLRRFYARHFIPVNPPDFRLSPISRTVGDDTIVDEFIVHFTHTTVMDWMLPGIPPTGRAVEIPSVAIVKFEGNKLAHERIYWDQASVLVQIGLLKPDGLPVTGAEAAHKLADKSMPSNGLMERWSEDEKK